MTTVLGIDVASASWSDVGAAALDFHDHRISAIVPAPIAWPGTPLTPEALAFAIDNFARKNSVSAVALDGPQGWRDPDTALNLPGVGRRCEYLCRAQGKTGVYGRTYPGTQRNWIEFSIELFKQLLSLPGVILADREGVRAAEGYLVLECFPTSAWRSSGLRPLPGKSKKPALGVYRDSLSDAYELPAFETDRHDDLQAVVAALSAVGAVGGPVLAVPQGVPSRVVATGRVEGLIWDVTPLSGPVSLSTPSPLLRVASSSPESVDKLAKADVCVTRGVLAQVNRAGTSQMQIAVRGLPGATKHQKLRVRIWVDAEDYLLVLGDSHAAWRSHQDSANLESFERLFALAADTPGTCLSVSRFEVLGSA